MSERCSRSATWRANPDWAAELGYDSDALARINRRSITELIELRDENPDLVAVVSGTIGPRGDGYAPATHMTAAEAEAYHSEQIGAFASAGADLVTAYTICYHDEAIGIAKAAAAHGVPVAISFTLETDGRLPSGESLGDAIQAVDAATDGAVAYYLINCAHPTHFAATVDEAPSGPPGSPASGPTRRRSRTPSSTSRRSSTKATPTTSPPAASRSGRRCRT